MKYLLLVAMVFCIACGPTQTEQLQAQMTVPEVVPAYTFIVKTGMLYPSVPAICLDSYEIKGDLVCLTRLGVTDCVQSTMIANIFTYRPGTKCLDAKDVKR